MELFSQEVEKDVLKSGKKFNFLIGPNHHKKILYKKNKYLKKINFEKL